MLHDSLFSGGLLGHDRIGMVDVIAGNDIRYSFGAYPILVIMVKY